MPFDPETRPFQKGETTLQGASLGADRLNQMLAPLNRLRREFESRERPDGEGDEFGRSFLILIDGAEQGRGVYSGWIISDMSSYDPGTNLPDNAGLKAMFIQSQANGTATITGLPALVLDLAEAGDDQSVTGNSGHRITFGGRIGLLQGIFVGYCTDGRPQVFVNFGRKSWKTRWNTVTHSLEQAHDWESNTPSWELIVAFDPCTSAQSTLATPTDQAIAAAASAIPASTGMLGGGHL